VENVLFIVVDTLRFDHLHSYGYARETSPQIDALAASGARFEHAYATAPWTTPSVASMITGLHPSAHTAVGHETRLPGAVDTLAEILSERGYRTAAVVSNGRLSAKQGFAQGYEIYRETEAGAPLSTRRVTRQAIELLEELRRDDRPFLLFAHYFDPHFYYIRHPEVGFAAPRVARLDGTQSSLELRKLVPTLTRREIRHLRDRYDDEIRYTDDGIGELLAALDASGVRDETLVVLTADHGEEFLDHGGLGHTRTLYEEVVRVPLAIRLPGATARIVEQAVSLVLLPPTILDLIGVPVDDRVFHGPSFAHLVTGEAGSELPGVFLEVDYEPSGAEHATKRAHKRAIRRGRFKLVRDEVRGTLELFDLETDARERRNLARARPRLAASLLDELSQATRLARRNAVAPSRRELSEQERSLLRELGYAD
jgi:arylsulfatase A-like enzyme